MSPSLFVRAGLGCALVALLATPAVSAAQTLPAHPTGNPAAGTTVARTAPAAPVIDRSSGRAPAQAWRKAVKDVDKDGLPDAWEKKKTNRGLNIKKLGATVRHKDLFVELDYSTRSGPSKLPCSELDALYRAFSNAPVKNPDGRTGIRLHLDAGKRCASRSYDLGGSSRFVVRDDSGQPVPPGQTGPCADYGGTTSKTAFKRLNVFHIGMIVADRELCSAEGQATDTDFIAKDLQGAYVMLHELGHIFGLDHGPINGFSVMGSTAIRANAVRNVDFRRYTVMGKDEASLDEHSSWTSNTAAGRTWLASFYAPQYCGGQPRFIVKNGGPVDWDCEGSPFWGPDPYSTYIDADPVSADINGDGVVGRIPTVTSEWLRVRLAGGRIGKR